MKNYHYAQIDTETGFVISDSWLSGEVNAPHMILIADDFELKGKKYVNGEWVEYTPEPIQPPEPEPTQLDRIEANTTALLGNESALDVLLGVE